MKCQSGPYYKNVTHLVVKGKYVPKALLEPDHLERIAWLEPICPLDKRIRNLLDLAPEVRHTLERLYMRQSNSGYN